MKYPIKFEYKDHTVEIEPGLMQFNCLIMKNGKYVDSGNAGFDPEKAIERAKKHIDNLLTCS